MQRDPAILPIGTSNYMLINMSNKFDFVQPLIGYVEKKANSFLEENGLGDLYDGIQQSAKNNDCSKIDYINRLLNDTISAVAENKKEDWNKVLNDFRSHYFSPNA